MGRDGGKHPHHHPGGHEGVQIHLRSQAQFNIFPVSRRTSDHTYKLYYSKPNFNLVCKSCTQLTSGLQQRTDISMAP